MRHEQSIEFKGRPSLHNRIAHPNSDIIRDNRSHNLWDCTKRGISREEMEVMSRSSYNFLVKFVKDGPEFDSERTIDGWKGEFVHNSRNKQNGSKMAVGSLGIRLWTRVDVVDEEKGAA